MSPPIDLLSAIRRTALINVAWSGLAFVAGLVLLAVGVVVGCVHCVAVPLALGAPLAGLYWLLVAAFPTWQLRHLGDERARQLALAEIEAQSRGSDVMYRALDGSKLWVLPDWLVILGADILIERRRDILLSYRQVTSHTRYGITTRTSHAVKIRSRSRDHTLDVTPEEAEWLPAILAQATPHAFAGYDPRTAGMSREQLAAEIDRRPR